MPADQAKKPRKRGAWSFDNGSHNPFRAGYMTGAPDLHWTVRDIHPYRFASYSAFLFQDDLAADSVQPVPVIQWPLNRPTTLTDDPLPCSDTATTSPSIAIQSCFDTNIQTSLRDVQLTEMLRSRLSTDAIISAARQRPFSRRFGRWPRLPNPPWPPPHPNILGPCSCDRPLDIVDPARIAPARRPSRPAPPL